jgi:hypothetical protein
MLIPLSSEGQLMLGTVEFAIHTLVETRLDAPFFYGEQRNDDTGARPATLRFF